MKPTNYSRWYVFHMGSGEYHQSAISLSDGRHARVLQRWWHANDEPPPSSYGEWRDEPEEWAKP